MKTFSLFIVLAFVFVVSSCKKDNETDPVNADPITYTSVREFLSGNEKPTQVYFINGSSGGVFTSSQGTEVNIPAQAFVTQSGSPVTGIVTIQFNDLFRKSDMLLADKPTTTTFGTPLKSGGEFFIKALQNGAPVLLANGKNIEVALPAALTGGMDSVNIQEPFILINDSASQLAWAPDPGATVFYDAGNYVYSMYQFSSPADSGTWCNSDNSSFFDAYPQVQLTFETANVTDYDVELFLVFKNIASMVHVYPNWFNSGEYKYSYAPQGLQCTLVALGLKNGILYSAFKTITITQSLTVNYTFTPTNSEEFKAVLNTLD